MKILFIDDNDWMRELYVHKLEKGGYEVISASSAQQALDRLDELNVDLIILDIIMPENNGLSIVYERPSYKDMREVPLFLLSSLSRRELAISDELWEQLGISGYYHKPDTKPADLLRIVDDFFGKAK